MRKFGSDFYHGAHIGQDKFSIVVPVLALHVSHRVKVRVLKRLGRSESLLVVVPQQPVEKVDGICVRKVLVLGRDEFLPGRARVAAEDGVEFVVETHAVLVKVADE